MKILKFIFLAIAFVAALPMTASAHYDPTIGRWISRDPIQEEGGVNLYSFVSNNPIEYIDLLGKIISQASGVIFQENNKLSSDYAKDPAAQTLNMNGTVHFIEQNNGFCFSVNGTYRPLVFFKSKYGDGQGGMRDSYYKLHELRHVQINSDQWNEFANEANQLAGCYCFKSCVDIVKQIIQTKLTIAVNEALINNLNYDFAEYVQVSDQTLKTAWSNKLESAYQAKHQAVNKLWELWRNYENTQCKPSDKPAGYYP
jgi:uncharacterized protein RhaS with RHS repeats